MGHRALLAYERDDEDSADSTADSTDSTTTNPTYDLHRSHWGGADFALARHLSRETPFAAETSFAVDPEPVATDLSLAEIVGQYLDFLHHEAFYRVTPEYETTAFHVCWFGLETDSDRVERSDTVGHGALIEARPYEGDDYLWGWFRGTKAGVGELVDREAMTPEEATQFLAARVESWADDREVILPG